MFSMGSPGALAGGWGAAALAEGVPLVGHLVVIQQGAHLVDGVLRDDVPEAGRAVRAGAGHDMAGRVDGDVVELVVVPAEPRDRLPAGHVEQPYHGVLAGCGQ